MPLGHMCLCAGNITHVVVLNGFGEVCLRCRSAGDGSL